MDLLWVMEVLGKTLDTLQVRDSLRLERTGEHPTHGGPEASFFTWGCCCGQVSLEPAVAAAKGGSGAAFLSLRCSWSPRRLGPGALLYVQGGGGMLLSNVNLRDCRL